MLKKIFAIFAIVLISTSLLFVTANLNVSAKKTDNKWQVATNGGSVEVFKNGTIELTTQQNTGFIPSACYYKAYTPTNSFVVSFKVQGITLRHVGVEIEATAPYASPFDSVNFEFAGNAFRMVRWTSGWVWNDFASGQANTWYTLQMTVYKDPFQIKGEVFNAQGQSLGSYTVTDMTTLGFADIRYIVIADWDAGADYIIKDVSIKSVR
jgi:hypothetical protein